MLEIQIPPKVLVTFILISVVLIFKYLWIAAIRHNNYPLQEKHKNWISVARNVSNLILVIGIAVVWLSELQNIAISVAAFTVAIVIATKELLQCFLGFFAWMTNRPFRVGDWIQVNDHCGEVASVDWVKFRLLEVDLDNGYAYTGKSITIMNSVLLAQPVTNLNFMRRYVMHSFSIVRGNEVNLFELKQSIMDTIETLISPFQEVASRYSNLISKRLEIEATSSEPFIDIHTTDVGNQVISITIFCPTEEAHSLEQEITERFMGFWYQKKQQTSNKPTE
ncbi:mechanosensitive ion channel family protein [Vibrio sp. TH_r3]|uniref:mechanosensitive ion channel family protein n=1 Tax=Vibrio sp. TH_r3 TaxID=3082084 RepID=UPI002952A491|nr:mechanosensitive ion channel family protein [Vibrio sp. TH_r3]MDV7103811.1 mechanosensitive ion channel family protein [Vibrio sp. TH_r3]